MQSLLECSDLVHSIAERLISNKRYSKYILFYLNSKLHLKCFFLKTFICIQYTNNKYIENFNKGMLLLKKKNQKCAWQYSSGFIKKKKKKKKKKKTDDNQSEKFDWAFSSGQLIKHMKNRKNKKIKLNNLFWR